MDSGEVRRDAEMIVFIVIVVYLALGLVFRPYSSVDAPLPVRMLIHALWLPLVIVLIAVIKSSKQSLL